MKKVLFTLFFFIGLAAVQLSAQTICDPNCPPNPSCCKPNPACCIDAKGAASVNQNTKAETTVCTPEQLKKCSLPASSTGAPATSDKRSAVAVRQEEK